MGNPDVESRYTQGLGSARRRGYCRRLCSTIGVASANRLTEGCNSPGCHGSILGLIRGVWGAGNAPKGVVNMMAEGAGGVRGQARMEKSTDCCHFAYKIKKMKDEEVKRVGEEPSYVCNLPTQPPRTQPAEAPSGAPGLL
jgi:hypothetical protein